MSKKSGQEKKGRLPIKKRELSRLRQKITLNPQSIQCRPPINVMKIGPYHSNEMVLCSADAGPSSQKNEPTQAQYFFPEGRWVAALRNTADSLKCNFLVLTTQHGLVERDQVITPYDMHINDFHQEITEKWSQTIPALMQASQYKLMIFYAGGCPRRPMLDVMLPVLRQQRVALLTFGRPNMYDVGMLDKIWNLLLRGSTDQEIKSILKAPECFEFYPFDELTPDDDHTHEDDHTDDIKLKK
jgi:hypothetical protein